MKSMKKSPNMNRFLDFFITKIYELNLDKKILN